MAASAFVLAVLDVPVAAEAAEHAGGAQICRPLPRKGIALPPPRTGGSGMAHPNEELIRRAYDAFSRGDVDTLRQLFADNAVFHEPGRNPISGDHQGIDQILAFVGLLAERSGGTYRVPLHEIVANDQHAVGLHVAEAEREGRRLHSLQTVVLHVRDGRITEAWAHHYDQHATDEFWA
jgi:uncharacterized protein